MCCSEAVVNSECSDGVGSDTTDGLVLREPLDDALIHCECREDRFELVPRLGNEGRPLNFTVLNA